MNYTLCLNLSGRKYIAHHCIMHYNFILFTSYYRYTYRCSYKLYYRMYGVLKYIVKNYSTFYYKLCIYVISYIYISTFTQARHLYSMHLFLKVLDLKRLCERTLIGVRISGKRKKPLMSDFKGNGTRLPDT